jgi:hypothetical protein
MLEATRRPRTGLWWSLVSTFALGLVLLAGRGVIPARVGWPHLNESIQEVARDLGIAFIVSSVVAVLFELYRSLHHQIEAMKDVIDAVMADKLTKAVWFELEELIEKKTVLRKELRVRLEAYRDEGLQPYEARLRVELEYLLEGIGKRRPVKISHDLDYQLANCQLKLPRFERITILRIAEGSIAAHGSEEKVLERAQLVEANKNGRFEQSFDALKPGETLRIRVVREEIVHIPGSYNLYTPEFTKGLRVLIAECPAELTTEVWVRPQGEGKHLVQTGNEWWTEELILPGQGVEVKFLSKS